MVKEKRKIVSKLKGTCLNPHCGRTNVKVSRGLCGRCYIFAKSLIDKNLVSKKELEMNGRMLPSKVGNIRGMKRDELGRLLPRDAS